MTTSFPLISIIIPNFNRGHMICSALNSVVELTYPNFELIVIDGNSSDNSMEIILNYKKILEEKGINLIAISEPDNGMYEALNKGISLANGDFIVFLNTDDRLTPSGLIDAMDIYQIDKRIKVIIGRALIKEVDDPLEYISDLYLPSPNQFPSLLQFVLSKTPAFNSWVFHKSIFLTLGMLDDQYKIAGDREFLLRLSLEKLPFKTSEALFYVYNKHAHSITFSRLNAKTVYEEIKIAETYKNKSIYDKHITKVISNWHKEIVWKSIKINVNRSEWANVFKQIFYLTRYYPFSFIILLTKLFIKDYFARMNHHEK